MNDTMIEEIYAEHPDWTTKMIQAETRRLGGGSGGMGYSKRQIRRRLHPLKPRPPEVEFRDDEESARLAHMVGLKKNIPKVYKEILAKYIMHVESALDRPKDVVPQKSSGKESAVLLISDTHSGKLVFDERGRPTYNKDILTYKMALLKMKVIKLLTKHVGLNNVDEIVIALLGDLVDGSGIYPQQEIAQDLNFFGDQVSLIVAAIWEIVLAVRKLGLTVRIEGVRGNHGRQGKYLPADNNFDYSVYQLLYMWAYETDGVTVDYSTTTEFKNFEVKGHNVHIRHEAPPQAETPAGRAKFAGLRAIHDYDIIAYGHLHHPSSGVYFNSDVIMNGAPIGQDDLSERMAVGARPSQTLFGVHPRIGVSFRYNVYLDEVAEGEFANEIMRKYPELKWM